eukprot:3086286-Amphidinium_carterae.2
MIEDATKTFVTCCVPYDFSRLVKGVCSCCFVRPNDKEMLSGHIAQLFQKQLERSMKVPPPKPASVTPHLRNCSLLGPGWC